MRPCKTVKLSLSSLRTRLDAYAPPRVRRGGSSFRIMPGLSFRFGGKRRR